MPLDELNQSELHRLCQEGYGALESRDFPLAIQLFDKCLAIDPDNAYVLNGIGVAFEGTSQFDTAVGFYRRAIAANQNSGFLHLNLGRVSIRLGDFEQAEASLLRACELKPESIAALRELGRLFRAKRDFSAATETFLKAMSLDPEHVDGLACAVITAVIYYLGGDYANAWRMVRKASPIADMPGAHYWGLKRYLVHVSRLLALSRDPQPEVFPTITVIGDSHSVSAHGANVVMNGVNFTCKSAWIEGCSQWRVGSESYNEHKMSFEISLRTTPKCNPVLLSIGQADCLSESGIFRQWQKNPAVDIEQIIDNTIRKYIAVILKYRGEGWHGIIINGLVAPGAECPAPEGPLGKVYLDMVRSFNARLKWFARDAALPFLDLYTMTETPAGISNGLWNVDDIHLRPEATTEAFRNHLLL